MPIVARSVLLAGLLTTLVVSTAPGTAQVAATSRLPLGRCLDPAQQTADVSDLQIPCKSSQTWLDLSSLRAVLEPLGVEIATPPATPGAAGRAAGPGVVFVFPGGRPVKVLTQYRFNRITLTASNLHDVAHEAPLIPGYVSTSEFLQVLAYQSGLPVTLTGWDNPRLAVGRTSFTLGLPKAPVRGLSLYAALAPALGPAFRDSFSVSNDSTPVGGEPLIYDGAGATPGPGGPTYRHRLRVQATPGQVFAVLSRGQPVTSDLGVLAAPVRIETPRRVYFAPASASGELEVFLSSPKVEFVASLDAFEDQGQTGVPKAVLLRLTGRLNPDPQGSSYEVVLPGRATSEAVR